MTRRQSSRRRRRVASTRRPPLARIPGILLRSLVHAGFVWSYVLGEGRRRRHRARGGGDPAGTGPPVSPGTVSVVIPTLCQDDQEDHLPRLRALLERHLPAQTHRDYEALVCLDGPNPRVARLVEGLDDGRVRLVPGPRTPGGHGHPQTRAGIEAARGAFFVRMNDDNEPFPEYLETLVGGLGDGADLSYARVLFRGPARRRHTAGHAGGIHYGLVKILAPHLVPMDRAGTLRLRNVDCMCFMTRLPLAREHAARWTDAYAADWEFVEALLAHGVRTRFVDRLVGVKW